MQKMEKYVVRLRAPEVKLLQSAEVMFSKLGKTSNKHTKRARTYWALKRSPHVFSKSQESFGIEVYTSVLSFNPQGQGKAYAVMGVVVQNIPARAISWQRIEGKLS